MDDDDEFVAVRGWLVTIAVLVLILIVVTL